MRIGVMKDSKTKAEETTRLTYTGLCHSCWYTHLERSETASFLSYTLRYVSFVEVDKHLDVTVSQR
jgi:hypothetical protein